MFNEVINYLNINNFEITFAVKRYQPFILALLGLLLEPISMLTRKKLPGTWELYGFESIIWAKKSY
jgi:hypothetical protein